MGLILFEGERCGAAAGLIFCLRERELREGSVEGEGEKERERERREKRFKKMKIKRKYNKRILTVARVNFQI